MLNGDKERMVSAAELVRNFASVRRRANDAPILITNHGKVSHVLCTASKFRSLSAHPAPASGEGEVGLDLAQLSAWVEEAIVLIDRAGRVRHTNAALLAMARSNPAGRAGGPIFDVLPELRQSIARAYIQRALEFGEQARFDMPSPFSEAAWLRCRLAPVGNDIAILLRDITREVQSLRMRDLQEEVMRAMELNNDIAFVRLSIRGFIERTNDNFIRLIGIGKDRLLGLHFINLVDLRMRAAVNEELERVLGQGEGRNVFTRLLTNHGRLIDVQMGVASTDDGYGCDGAAIVMNKIDSPVAARRVPSLVRHGSPADTDYRLSTPEVENPGKCIKLRGIA